MKGMTRRESVLMILVFLSAVVMGYPQFRYKPLKAALKGVQARTDSSNLRLRNVKWPKEPGQTAEETQAELVKAEALLQKAQERLTEKESRLVSQGDVLDVQELRVQISALARKNRVLINRSITLSEKEPGSEKAKGHLLNLLKSGEHSRPLQELQMSATYSRLRRFLKGLDSLSHAVSVVWFDIQVGSAAPTGRGETLLTVTLVLAL